MFCSPFRKRFVSRILLLFVAANVYAVVVAASMTAATVTNVQKEGSTKVLLKFNNGQSRTLDFYSDGIFRLFQDPKNKPLRDPEAKPEANILVDNPRATLNSLQVSDNSEEVLITTSKVKIEINKQNGCMKVFNLRSGRQVLEETTAAEITPEKVTLTLSEQSNEYFFGGGVQNGRFSHRGQKINIVNENSWTDGGVASPTPFYWSTAGYAIMFYTFRPGHYDFGAKKPGTVTLQHETDYLDCFVMVDDGAVPLLNDYYQLTGHPILLPKFGFYEGHLNAYNRDYWKESKNGNGMLFEDGKHYNESMKDEGNATKESLNGEDHNYQFSARAVVDRYAAHDMPLGWILPNDGYGAGYGQTTSLDGNIQNLKDFGDYARSHGVEIGLWTQSDLHPIDSIKPLLQRDISKEIGVAGVRVLKTDVAWVGAGYSFGLNGIADAAGLMTQHGSNARPMIITLDGWAGTQRYAGVWTGDQTGGKWEYIRFHVPTYIGSGLAGMPNISSDMDGIFGGKNSVVNIRDFQWKTFTPMQLNMDGWGSNEKYPHALGEPAASINRNYLKLKSALMPYLYTAAHEAINGQPMLRAMFLSEPNRYTLGKATEYQFLCGPWFLVAPIYQETQMDKDGNDVRNGIYLPKGQWIDFFTGDTYTGGNVLNNYEAPIWKLPLFVKAGAIIPVTLPNNNVKQIPADLRMYEVYPAGHSEFTEYDDDGRTEAYLHGDSATTRLVSDVQKDVLTLTVEPMRGSFKEMTREKTSVFLVNMTEKPKSLKVKIGKKRVKMHEVSTYKEFETGDNVYFYQAAPNLNLFSTPGSEAQNLAVTKNPQLLVKIGKTDVAAATTVVTVKGFVFDKPNPLFRQTEALSAPADVKVEEANRKPYSLTPSWNATDHADCYEILYDSMLYTGIRQTNLEFAGLQPNTSYSFKVRAVNKGGHSPWTDLSATTNTDPFEHAIHGITATCTAASQGGEGTSRLFDFDESNMWHTKYQTKATPFELVADLHAVSILDKMTYLPRQVGANGLITSGTIYTSMDKMNWTKAGTIAWTTTSEKKTFVFASHPTARYVKISVDKAVGDYGSGQELYFFRVPNTPSYVPGDINNDKILDDNDLTSYMNYTGLRLGDKDFEGYVSNGDINKNNLIDAYDISNAAVMVDDKARAEAGEMVDGKIVLVPDKKTYKVGDEVKVTVHGFGLSAVNALSFALPYAPTAYEYEGTELLAVKEMKNFTNDRLHSNGSKSLYPTFVNVGDKISLKGTVDLFVLRFKAQKSGPFSLKLSDGILVDKNLIYKSF